MHPLQTLSKSYTPVPNLTIWMLPYIPYVYQGQREKLLAWLAEQGDEFDQSLYNFFIISLPLITRIDRADPVPAWVPALVKCQEVYAANGIIACWQLFVQVTHADMLNALYSTYENTRDDLPTGPEILQSEMPVPEDDDGTENPSTASGGKRSRKK